MGIAQKKEAHSSHKLSLTEVLDALKDEGIISEEIVTKVAERNKLSKLHPLIIIDKSQLFDMRDKQRPLSLEYLVEWLAQYSGLEYFEIDPLKINIDEVTSILPKRYIERLSCIPILVEEEFVTFATAEPFNTSWIPEVSMVLKKQIKLKVSNPKQIEHCMEEFYTVRDAIKNMNLSSGGASEFGSVQELDKMLATSKKKNQFGSDDSSIAEIVDWLFQYSFDERATDIHIEPREGKGQVRFRIDGILRVVYKFEPAVLLPIISRIKILANMKVDEKRRPQDGRIKKRLSAGKLIELRLSSIPTHYGEKLVIRIFDSQVTGISFEKLGFSNRDIKTWTELITKPYGLVLVTGPTGSGKTTTLHTSLGLLAKEDVNICTVEDPVEVVNDRFAQMQVHHAVDITFANAVRSFLRQDPDIIMVGEIRDCEAGEMAFQAALTGHMVLSTLHTNSALASIPRLIDLGIPSHIVNAALLGVLAQRLVRVLCAHCKEKRPTPISLWDSLVRPYKVAPPKYVYVPKGCIECKRSGYNGRLCVYELISLNEEMKSKITPDVELVDLEKLARGNYIPLRLNGAQKVAQGKTSIEEVLRVTY